jgi:putative glutamine amidotransferase
MNVIVNMREEVDRHEQSISVIENDYIELLSSLNLNPVLVANTSIEPFNTLSAITQISMIVLTGGGNAIDRNTIRSRVENELIQFALENSIPILGICRGMQAFLLNQSLSYLEEDLTGDRVPGQRHLMRITESVDIEVNHYHNFFFSASSENLQKYLLGIDLAKNSIETIFIPKLKFLGFQWHPERELANSKSREFALMSIQKLLRLRGDSH